VNSFSAFFTIQCVLDIEFIGVNFAIEYTQLKGRF